MPYADRVGLRQRPLGDEPGALTFPVSDECSIVIYARPGRVLFIEAMWHGDYQQVPVDPDHVDDPIAALQEARAYVIDERRKGPS
jgi:hypothetical protein